MKTSQSFANRKEKYRRRRKKKNEKKSWKNGEELSFDVFFAVVDERPQATFKYSEYLSI